eukprot:3679859-Amphidinium_carterae.1
MIDCLRYLRGRAWLEEKTKVNKPLAVHGAASFGACQRLHAYDVSATLLLTVAHEAQKRRREPKGLANEALTNGAIEASSPLSLSYCFWSTTAHSFTQEPAHTANQPTKS